MLAQTQDRLGDAEADRGAMEAELRTLRGQLGERAAPSRRPTERATERSDNPALDMAREWAARREADAKPEPDPVPERPFWVVGFWWVLELVGAMAGGSSSFDRRKVPGTGATLAVMGGILLVIGLIAAAVWFTTRG